MDAVFKTISRHSSALATGFAPASRFAAWIPMGVAAFPRPKKLAHTLLLKKPASTGSFRKEGNILPKIGRSTLESMAVTPPFSISFPTPVQRQIEPAKEIAKVIPFCAPWLTAPERASPRPVQMAAMTESPTMPIHTQLITKSTTPFSELYACEGGICKEKPDLSYAGQIRLCKLFLQYFFTPGALVAFGAQ